jgi:DNA-binding NarL/FixJ family response regulator
MSLRDASSRSPDEQRPSRGGSSTSPLESAAALEFDDARKKFETLNLRERSVLQGVAEGYGVVDIARLLRTTPKTVDTYKTRMARKLGFTHRNDYVRFALQLGLIGNSSRQQGATTTGSRS